MRQVPRKLFAARVDFMYGLITEGEWFRIYAKALSATARAYEEVKNFNKDKSKKVAISVTLDKELFDFIEHGIRMRWWLNRSQAINMMGFAFIRSQQNMQQGSQPTSHIPPNFGRLPP